MPETAFENRAPTARLYTSLPYPADGVVRTVHARILRNGVKERAPELLERERLRILDVGCGTGEHTLGLKKLFPSAEVVGVDINPASLELSQKLAQRAGALVQFVQADISQNLAERLHVAAPGPFEIVSSIGVIHHLEDPRVGFAALRQLVHPKSLFYGYVYTYYGRREEMAIKLLLNEIVPDRFEWKARSDAIRCLRLTNVHSLASGIKRLRHRFRFGPPILPWELFRVLLNRNRLIHESDTYSNPCEHLYRFADLRSQLAEAGWKDLSLARFGGLPTSPREHTARPRELAQLRDISQDSLYDYFAFYYEVSGFTFFCRADENVAAVA